MRCTSLLPPRSLRPKSSIPPFTAARADPAASSRADGIVATLLLKSQRGKWKRCTATHVPMQIPSVAQSECQNGAVANRVVLDHLPLVRPLPFGSMNICQVHLDVTISGTPGSWVCSMPPAVDPETKSPFSSLQSTQSKGAILDSLRLLDWPHATSAPPPTVEAATRELASRCNRNPTERKSHKRWIDPTLAQLMLDLRNVVWCRLLLRSNENDRLRSRFPIAKPRRIRIVCAHQQTRGVLMVA